MSQTSSSTYWFASGPKRLVWCGFTNEAAFKAAAERQNPTESARISISAGALKELTYQVQPESGDWIVIDKYSPTKGGMVLKRANLLAQENLQIIQQARIVGGSAQPFKTENVTTLDGKPAKVGGQIDYPVVPIRTNASQFPFMKLVSALTRSAKVCLK
jgi:hypothetical protein